MGGFLSVTVTGSERVAAILAAYQDLLQDLRPFWIEVFAPKFFGDIQDRFALEGQSRGSGGVFGSGHWAPLSARYAAWKAIHFPGRGILQRSGDLQASMVWDGTGVGPGGLFEAHPDHVVAGTAIPYGDAHQRGRAPTMPARPFLDPPDLSVYGPLLQAWLVRSVAARVA